MARGLRPLRFRSGCKCGRRPRHRRAYRRTAMPFGPSQSRSHCAHIGQLATVHYRWHPLHGLSMRHILTERRASGEIAHIELAPGNVTMVAAWKLDPVICGGMHIGAPQVSLAALHHLHELLVACESRLNSVDSNVVQEKAHVGIADTDRSNDTTCSQTSVKPPKIRATVPSRTRRRAGAGHDASGSSDSTHVAGAVAARSRRNIKRGEQR